jgi:hypothetical protein
LVERLKMLPVKISPLKMMLKQTVDDAKTMATAMMWRIFRSPTCSSINVALVKHNIRTMLKEQRLTQVAVAAIS